MMRVLLLISLFIAGCTSNEPRYVIMAPNVFYVGVPQKIHVGLYDTQSAHNIELEIKAQIIHSGEIKTIASDHARLLPGQHGLLSLTVGLDKASENLARKDKQFFLQSRIRELGISKRTEVSVSYSDGVILIQTDKPIYTPNQKVNIRVVPLGFNLMPSTKKVALIVKNPQGIRVRQWYNLTTDSGFINKVVNIGSYALTGNWTVEAYYGHLLVHNTSIKFEIREYILPKFSVKIKGPRYVLSTTPPFEVSVEAKYTYGKSVQGFVAVRLYVTGVVKDPIQLFSFRSMLSKSSKGVFKFDVEMEKIKNLLNDKWFPAIEGHRLQIVADVTEKSTGKTERAVDNSIYFVTSPYRIEYVDTARYFNPGLPFTLKVKVTYPNKANAEGIPMELTAEAFGKNNDAIQSYIKASKSEDNWNKANTDEKGIAMFAVNVASQVARLDIKVKTIDDSIETSQNAVKTLVVEASDSKELMKLRPRQMQSQFKVGWNAVCEAVISIKTVERLSYFIVSRGQIVYNSTITNPGTIATISFKVTAIMSPSSRLVAYYVSRNGKIVSDSILLDIEDEFPNQIFLLPPNNHKEQNPSENYDIKILGTVGTYVNLLGVDQSVYLLSKMSILTPESVFKKLEDFDSGCGAGSGKNSEDVFKNAGMVVISHDMTVAGRENCQEKPRRTKRSTTEDQLDFCCSLGNKTDPNKRNCYRRKMELDVRVLREEKLIEDCKMKYLNCCINAFGTKDIGMLARSGDNPMMMGQEPDDIPTRQFFPETWINEEIVISKKERGNECRLLRSQLLQKKCGSAVFPVSLPDTMTTWIVQAMGISNTTGFGIAKQLEITTFKQFFIHLSMPYSVQRGEEITILATLFNYKKYDVSVHLFLRGDKSFCSMALPGKTSMLTSSRITVASQDSVSFSITIVPKKYGKIPIEVTATGPLVDDKILKELIVVPEGVEERVTQSYVLDPREYFKGIKQPGEKQKNDSEIQLLQSTQARNQSSGIQIDKILLTVPKKAIPGSISGKVYLTGNMIGQAVTNLAAGKLEMLLQLPGGCGEQNMVRIAPNVYILHYLEKTKQVIDEIEKKKNDHIQEGFTHEMDYRQKDGSFAAFRSSEKPGSTWLTAFVVKVFCQANQLKGIDIGKTILCESSNWILKKQRQDGAFIEDLKVGSSTLGATNSYTSDVALTAFVLIALKKCNCGGLLGDHSVQRATAFLERRAPNLTDPYALAITTYALVLVDSNVGFTANQKLIQKATFNPKIPSRYWETGSTTRNIATASYALLAQLAINRGLEYAGPIAVWLTKQRRYGGGFVSTTDTGVALEALAKYSEQLEMVKLNMKVWIKNKSKKLTKDNFLLQQEVDIQPYLNEELSVETKGTGIGQMQVDIKYNVPSKKEDRCDFHLTIKITEEKSGRLISATGSDVKSRPKRSIRKKCKRRKRKRKGRKCRPVIQKEQTYKSLVVTICARYKKPGSTGMAIIDAGILTGYTVDQESLQKILMKKNTSIAKYELSDRAVVFYLDQIESTEPVCVAFSMTHDFNVGGIQPVPVKVYDYYEPDESCTVFYNLGRSSKSMGRCRGQVCKCTQGECPVANPVVKNVNKMLKKACSKFDYAIKGLVVLVDEDNTWLTYVIEVINVVKQDPKHPIKVKDTIEFKKQGSCITASMEKEEIVFIMGRKIEGQYVLDKSAFVKTLLKKGKGKGKNKDVRNKKDERKVDELARRISNGGCGA